MIQAISAITNKKVSKKKMDNRHAVPAFQGSLASKHPVQDTFVKGCKK